MSSFQSSSGSLSEGGGGGGAGGGAGQGLMHSDIDQLASSFASPATSIATSIVKGDESGSMSESEKALSSLAAISSSSDISTNSFRFECDTGAEPCRIVGHFIKLDRSIFLVLGDEAVGGDSRLSNLVMGMATRFDKMPLTTQLLTAQHGDGGAELGNLIAARLSKRLNLQAFVSCNIDVGRYEDLDPEVAGPPSLASSILDSLVKVLGPHF